MGQLKRVSGGIVYVHPWLHRADVTRGVYFYQNWQFLLGGLNNPDKSGDVVLLIFEDGWLNLALTGIGVVLAGETWLSLLSLGDHGFVLVDESGFGVVEDVGGWGQLGGLGAFEVDVVGWSRPFFAFGPAGSLELGEMTMDFVEFGLEVLYFIVLVAVLLIPEGSGLILDIFKLYFYVFNSFL